MFFTSYNWAVYNILLTALYCIKAGPYDLKNFVMINSQLNLDNDECNNISQWYIVVLLMLVQICLPKQLKIIKSFNLC